MYLTLNKDYILFTNLFKNLIQIIMKKLLISVMLLCGSTLGFAQLLNVSSVQKVNLPKGTVVDKATISPKGDFIVVSDIRKEGLQKYDLATGKMQTITNASGIGSDVQISADGTTIVYRESKVGSDRLRRTAVKTTNIATGASKTIVKATRNLQGVALKGNSVVSIDNGKVQAASLNAEAANKSIPVASIKYGQLMLTVNGKTKVISPNGTNGQSYLWPSVSPDGTKVLYYLATKGTFVCDIDGSNPRHIGYLRAPKWYNNDIVIGMNDKDNGEFVTASTVYATSIVTSEKQAISMAGTIAMYPTVNANGSKIVYSTPAGEAFIINVNAK